MYIPQTAVTIYHVNGSRVIVLGKTGRFKFEDDTVFKAISNRGENGVLLS